MNSNMYCPSSNTNHLNGVLKVTIFNCYDVPQKLLKLNFEFIRATEAQIVQINRLFGHRLYRFDFKRFVETFTRLGKLAVIGVEARDYVIKIDDTVLWHELIHCFKWPKLLKFEC